MHATEMWKHFDKKVVEEDFKGLKAAGVTVLRVFPRWSDFQPLIAAYTTGRIYEIQTKGKFLPDTESGRVGVSEEMCCRFKRFKNKSDIIGCDLGNEPNSLGAGDENEFYNWRNNV